ncbi:MAG: 30S ribosomal protein S5 [Fimbriimonadales bacterium]
MRKIERRDTIGSEFDVRVVRNNKVFKTHKGGKTASWSVLVVVGDHAGRVGVGLGKARGVPDAIRKGEEAARRAMIEVPMVAGTLPHDVRAKTGATLVWLKPASPGTGVVAGGAVRSILEAAGVQDVLAKVFGSRNAVNCAWATIAALQQLKAPEVVAESRGLPVRELVPWIPRLRGEAGVDA